MSRVSLGQLIRLRRERAGLTQEALAERSGVSVRAIRDVETGRIGQPRPSSLNLLARALGLTPEERAQLSGADGQPPLWLGRRPLLEHLVGRDEVLDRLAKLVAERSLVTVTGPGGVGKTAVAHHVADRLSAGYPDGVIALDLGGLPPELRDDPAGHIELVAARLLVIGKMAASGRESGLDTAARLLGGRRLLLVDNAEHVAASCAILLDHLRRTCPDLGVLVTSRRPLGLTGETIWELAPLKDDEALSLMRKRADQHCAERKSMVDDQQLRDLCRRLGGLPLAIELAAARLGSMAPAMLLRHIDQNPRLLSGENPTVYAHQRGLATTIDWSVDLLTKQQRMLLARLSAFVAQFKLESAARVCADDQLEEAALPGMLSDLVTHSLVQVVDGNRESFELLPPIRDHLLATADPIDMAATRERHLGRYAEMAAALAGSANHDEAILATLRDEVQDVMVALAWGLSAESPVDRAELATLLLAQARPLWDLHRGSLKTLSGWTRLALAHEDGLSRRTRILLHHWAARLSFYLGRSDPAWCHLSKALELIGDDVAHEEVRIDLMAGRIALAGRNLDPRTTEYALEAVQFAQSFHRPEVAVPVMADLIFALCIGGRHEEARRCSEDAERLAGESRVLRRDWRNGRVQLGVRLNEFELVERLAAEILADDLSDTIDIQEALHGRGLARALRGDIPGARADFAAALKSLAESGRVEGKATLLVSQAFAINLAGDEQAAASTLREGLTVSLEHNTLFAGVRGVFLAAAIAHSSGHPATVEINAHAKRCRDVTGLPLWPLDEQSYANWNDYDPLSVHVTPALQATASITEVLGML